MKLVITISALIITLSLIVSASLAHQWCWTCNQDNTYGWQIMTPNERKEHQAKLSNITSYSTCKEYIDTHHRMIENRAKEKGIGLPDMLHNPCDEMKAKGILK